MYVLILHTSIIGKENYEIVYIVFMCLSTYIYIVRFYSIPCLQSLPVHIEGHVHISGAEQFPPLKQPVGHTAL